ELADLIGMPAPHLSRMRKKLEADGWLEYTHSEGQVKFYRLGERATGRDVVVPLHRKNTG
ncbi:hypothetical protein AB0O47_40305, partial [Streptomyces noursei]